MLPFQCLGLKKFLLFVAMLQQVTPPKAFPPGEKPTDEHLLFVRSATQKKKGGVVFP